MAGWRLSIGVLIAASVALTSAAAPDCLGYLAADKAFHDRMVVHQPIVRAVGQALEAEDEVALRALELQDEGRWKAFIESWKKLNRATWEAAHTEAKAAADAAWNDYKAIPAAYEDASPEAAAARNTAWEDYKVASGKADAARRFRSGRLARW